VKSLNQIILTIKECFFNLTLQKDTINHEVSRSQTRAKDKFAILNYSNNFIQL
jgi:hypothetical protein